MRFVAEWKSYASNAAASRRPQIGGLSRRRDSCGKMADNTVCRLLSRKEAAAGTWIECASLVTRTTCESRTAVAIYSVLIKLKINNL